ncbi:hypothetical protein FGO68_gene10596 [Halteria grandinella]|uniref:Choline kinase n=1 Tax=Halteria grandinella TaxID=5974 RepID=A0A8J8NDV1_HALGN|nr:hypothetical protein FGO68_gene10596 [Halteria grandinella]
MSNKTYIVSSKTKEEAKIVIRIFLSKASDFDLESKIFKCLGGQGIGPKEIEVTPVYRVEECIDGRALTYLELRDSEIGTRLMQMICQMNYDENLKELVSDRTSIQSRDFIEDRQKGWFWRYKEEVQKTLEGSSQLRLRPRGRIIQEYFTKLMQHEDELISDYRELFSIYDPAKRPHDVVFSHNDFQENNVLINNTEQLKLTLIDFEYSGPNYRGYDIASFMNEQFMDYIIKEAPFFKIMPEEYCEYLRDSVKASSIFEEHIESYLRTYASLINTPNPEEFIKNERAIFKDQVYRCILMSHIQWVFWCFIMMPHERLNTEEGANKCLEFHMEYAYQRMQLYFKVRNIILPSLAHRLPDPNEEGSD